MFLELCITCISALKRADISSGSKVITRGNWHNSIKLNYNKKYVNMFESNQNNKKAKIKIYSLIKIVYEIWGK